MPVFKFLIFNATVTFFVYAACLDKIVLALPIRRDFLSKSIYYTEKRQKIEYYGRHNI